ncbi:MAG: PTS sugar transporter subunit IIA [Mogibacterium sp.]|nr:PTS sugar transporter subunit IIA [Mogibacterium sp.]
MKYAIIVAENKEYSSSEECLQTLADLLLAEGKVKEGYRESVTDREKHYPTALTLSPTFGVAIPHPWSAEFTVEPALAVAVSKKPFTMHSMADPAEEINTSVVVMMALNSDGEHVPMLQKMLTAFQDDTFVDAIKKDDSTAITQSLFDDLINKGM